MNENKKLIQLVVSFAIFIESLDTTILNTAIPTMSQVLHVSPINLKVALLSYLLTLAIFVPISGWVADKWGAKKTFIFSLILFTSSSIACGFSQSLYELIIMRSIQGVAGAFLMPIARLIMIRSAGRSGMVKAMGQAVLLGSLGLMLGPVLGGIITEYLSWSWIFFVNAPFGLIAIIIAQKVLNEYRVVDVNPFDRVGFFLFGFGLAFFMFGLSAFSESGLPLRYAIYTILTGFILLSIYVIYAQRKKHPVINVRLFKFHTFKISVFGNLFTRIGFGGVPFLLPLVLQISFNYSPAQSGILIMPLALGIMFSKFFTERLLRWLGYRRYLIINTILVGFSVISFAFIYEPIAVPYVLITTFIFGLITSQQYSGMNSLAYQEVNETQLSSATSFMGTLQQFAQSFGVAIAAILLQLSLFIFNVPHLTRFVFQCVFLVLGFITLMSGFIFSSLNAAKVTNKVPL